VTQQVLRNGDRVTIGREVTIEYRERMGFQSVTPRPAAAPLPPTQMLDITSDTITIGRARDNKMVLDHPRVSRYHAAIERLGTRQRVIDLKSANGVFLNGVRVERQAWIKEGDELGIGPYRVRVGQNTLQQGRPHRRDAVAEMGQQEEELAARSIALHPPAGVRGAGGLERFRQVHTDGCHQWVPSRHPRRGFCQDIVHTELTVYSALNYAAQLRMPADTTPDERHQRIMEVLEELDLSERKDLPIHKLSELSGGQLKRVSIGVELLTKPRLFFLDEPTSGLDPGTEYNMMRLLRKLADQGRTIVLITHATKNVMMCDTSCVGDTWPITARLRRRSRTSISSVRSRSGAPRISSSTISM